MKRGNKANPKKKVSAKSKAKATGRVQDQPFFGMWADREDMKDVEAWVRQIRAPRYTFSPDGPIRKPDRPKPARSKS